jgi:hypothetical protein
VAIVVATTSVAHADETSPKPKDHYEWLAPLVLAGTGAGAMALANAEGMDWGRVAIDSTFASVGFGVGMGLSYWLVRTNERSIDKLIWGVAVVTAASTLGGIGLGEAISGREPFPKGTGWPATGGLAVGVVVDLGAIVAVMSAKHDQALLIVTMVLLPIVVGATSVAGFALALPK